MESHGNTLLEQIFSYEAEHFSHLPLQNNFKMGPNINRFAFPVNAFSTVMTSHVVDYLIVTETSELQRPYMYMRSCAPSEDSDHPALSRSLMRIFTKCISENAFISFKSFFLMCLHTSFQDEEQYLWVRLIRLQLVQNLQQVKQQRGNSLQVFRERRHRRSIYSL